MVIFHSYVKLPEGKPKRVNVYIEKDVENSTISMAIFNSYVKLPEGNDSWNHGTTTVADSDWTLWTPVLEMKWPVQIHQVTWFLSVNPNAPTNIAIKVLIYIYTIMNFHSYVRLPEGQRVRLISVKTIRGTLEPTSVAHLRQDEKSRTSSRQGTSGKARSKADPWLDAGVITLIGAWPVVLGEKVGTRWHNGSEFLSNMSVQQ